MEGTVTNEVYERLKTKLVLDPLELDQELIELPMLIMECAEYTSEKLAQRDRCKNALDLAMAEASDGLRTELTIDVKGNNKQRSEAQISSEVFLDEGVQRSLTDLEQSALMDSLKAKRDSLKIFSELTISGYLSPNVALDNRRAEIRAASSGVRRRPVNNS
jgi:hypothetical protein